MQHPRKSGHRIVHGDSTESKLLNHAVGAASKLCTSLFSCQCVRVHDFTHRTNTISNTSVVMSSSNETNRERESEKKTNQNNSTTLVGNGKAKSETMAATNAVVA